MRTQRNLSDVIREIAADQLARGFAGRSAAELQAEKDANLAERDMELNAARGGVSPGGR